MRSWVIGALVAVPLVLVACGNGGGSGPTVESFTVNGEPFGEESLAASESWDEEEQDGVGTATVSWQIPTETADGEPLEMLAIEGYRLYFSAVGEEEIYCVEIDDPMVTEYQVTGLEAGDYGFTLTTIDNEGRESAPSNVMTKTVT